LITEKNILKKVKDVVIPQTKFNKSFDVIDDTDNGIDNNKNK